jgi:putative hydrolase of the HAD superfamily
MGIKNRVIIFDLDDTLYKEVDFLRSGYHAIVNRIYSDFSYKLNFENLFTLYVKGNNVFNYIVEKKISNIITIDYLLNIYRDHMPVITLEEGALKLFKEFKVRGYKLGIITDGRSKTQRNKLKALGVIDLFDEIVISEEFGSEKPALENYKYFVIKFPEANYFYIGDNIRKDFVTPNRLGWTTIGIKDIHKLNIHSQEVKVSNEYLPKEWISSLSELKI